MRVMHILSWAAAPVFCISGRCNYLVAELEAGPIKSSTANSGGTPQRIGTPLVPIQLVTYRYWSLSLTSPWHQRRGALVAFLTMPMPGN
jgi:hypothetical protein